MRPNTIVRKITTTPPLALVRKLTDRLSVASRLIFADFRQVPPAILRTRRTGKKPYILAYTGYMHNSAGRVACHRLVHELNLAGYDAFSLGPVNPLWKELSLTRLGLFFLMRFGDPIVIYPEVISGNPVGARRVARWVLNVPGHLGGDAEFDHRELVYAWSKEFYDTDRILSWDVVDRALFNDYNLPPKEKVCCYVGKGELRGANPIPFTEGMIQITRSWPPARREMAELLRATRVLYTYDDVTMLIFEALLCGCQVILLPEYRELKLDDPLWQFVDADHHAELDRFIKETQNLAN